MTVEQLVADLIQVFEGCKLEAYEDTGGIWTIGFGHTGTEVKEGLTITYQQAVLYYIQDSKPLFALVQDQPFWSQVGYVSFAYNCGVTALKLVISGKSDILHWVHDRHGNDLPGLIKRRTFESDLVNYGKETK